MPSAAAAAVAAAADGSVGSNGLHKVAATLQLDLHPSTLGDVDFGVHQQLDARLLRHCNELGGVVISYSNVSVKQNVAPIHKYFPLYRVHVSADWLVFCPVVGSQYVAQVNAVSADFISLLVFGYFPVAIRVENMPTAFQCDNQAKTWASTKHPEHTIREGDDVIFCLASLENSSWLQLVGSLKEAGTGLASYVQKRAAKAAAKQAKQAKRAAAASATDATTNHGGQGANVAPAETSGKSKGKKRKAEAAAVEAAAAAARANGPASSGAAPGAAAHRQTPSTSAPLGGQAATGSQHAPADRQAGGTGEQPGKKKQKVTEAPASAMAASAGAQQGATGGADRAATGTSSQAPSRPQGTAGGSSHKVSNPHANGPSSRQSVPGGTTATGGMLPNGVAGKTDKATKTSKTAASGTPVRAGQAALGTLSAAAEPLQRQQQPGASTSALASAGTKAKGPGKATPDAGAPLANGHLTAPVGGKPSAYKSNQPAVAPGDASGSRGIASTSGVAVYTTVTAGPSGDRGEAGLSAAMGAEPLSKKERKLQRKREVESSNGHVTAPAGSDAAAAAAVGAAGAADGQAADQTKKEKKKRRREGGEQT